MQGQGKPTRIYNNDGFNSVRDEYSSMLFHRMEFTHLRETTREASNCNRIKKATGKSAVLPRTFLVPRFVAMLIDDQKTVFVDLQGEFGIDLVGLMYIF